VSAAGSVLPRAGAVAASRLGTVVVTGASGFVGRHLLEALAATDAWTVALTSRHRRLPARVTLAVSLDGSVAREAIEDADQVVHLAGGLRPEAGMYWDANVGTARDVAAAVRRGRARRVVFLSVLGADPASANDYLRTKAEAERVLASAGRDLVVFRAGHIVGPPEDPGPLLEALGLRNGGSVLVPGDGTQRVAPVFVGDVVAALVAALRGGPPGTYDLVGRDEMALNQLVTLCGGPGARVRHVPAPLARLAAHVLPSLPPAVVDVLLRPGVGDPTAVERAFGIKVRSLPGLARPA
jgi:nucleoside-diphosphate-sugar epimerase